MHTHTTTTIVTNITEVSALFAILCEMCSDAHFFKGIYLPAQTVVRVTRTLVHLLAPDVTNLNSLANKHTFATTHHAFCSKLPEVLKPLCYQLCLIYEIEWVYKKVGNHIS